VFVSLFWALFSGGPTTTLDSPPNFRLTLAMAMTWPLVPTHYFSVTYRGFARKFARAPSRRQYTGASSSPPAPLL
jgi:hypothetical protein